MSADYCTNDWVIRFCALDVDFLRCVMLIDNVLHMIRWYFSDTYRLCERSVYFVLVRT